jgi:hypothetical protein
MRTPEQRARRWLRVYRSAYRQRRGEELVATLLDKARDDPRLPVREIRAIIVHAGSMRVRQLRVLTVVACVSVIGAGLGAAVGWWSAPNGYGSTMTALPAQLGPASKPSPALTEELRSEETRFAAFRATPAALALIERNLVAPYPSCSVSVIDTVGDRGVQLQCSSPSAQTTQTAIGNQQDALAAMFERDRDATFSQAEAPTNRVVGRMRLGVSLFEHKLTASPPSSPIHAVLDQMLSQVRGRLSLEGSLAARLKNPPAGIMPVVSGPPITTHGGITVLPIELGAAAGLLIGLAIGAGTRRERRRPVRA